MSDLDVAVTLGTLELLEPDFEVVSVVTSGRTWRRRTVEGPFMHGRALLGAVLEQDTLTVEVRCKGTTWVAAQNRLAELMDAVEPLAFTAVVTIEGHTVTYQCETADVVAPLEKFRAMSSMIEATLTIPAQPS